jgi:cytochrome c oxidase subunit 3
MMTALVIGMLTGITVWWLLVQRLKTKPWLEQGVIAASQDDFTSSAPKVGLWVFLGVVSSLFLIFTGAYTMRMGHGHGGGLHEWVPLDDPNLLWLNTAVLVGASLAMQLARYAADRNDVDTLRKYFTAAGILSVVFLLGQFWAWKMLDATGSYTAASPAYTFFVLLTGVHGLHLLGGLWVLVRASLRMWRGVERHDVATLSALQMSVQLCTTYWHFLLLVWAGLFWLLLST